MKVFLSIITEHDLSYCNKKLITAKQVVFVVQRYGQLKKSKNLHNHNNIKSSQKQIPTKHLTIFKCWNPDLQTNVNFDKPEGLDNIIGWTIYA